MTLHQYIERETLEIRTERLYWDRVVGFCYSRVREHAPSVFKILTGRRASGLLGFLNYGLFMGGRLAGPLQFAHKAGINLSECCERPDALTTPKSIFERKIRYWECRPMPDHPDHVLSPADARMIPGSFRNTDALFVKDKFFEYGKIFGPDKDRWSDSFREGDFAIFRLTPEKYHYNHTPVSGVVRDIYEVDGLYHSCNPTAVITIMTPYSLNKRVVTIIDTDVPEGTGVGLVAMIEVAALMIGEIVQCYSEERYDNPKDILPGMFLTKGSPKSLYRPGSSTDILIFQKGRIEFAGDIVFNLGDKRVANRFRGWFGDSLVETEVQVRSFIAARKKIPAKSEAP
jgi:phosphatidylserine decarboxylase